MQQIQPFHERWRDLTVKRIADEEPHSSEASLWVWSSECSDSELAGGWPLNRLTLSWPQMIIHKGAGCDSITAKCALTNHSLESCRKEMKRLTVSSKPTMRVRWRNQAETAATDAVGVDQGDLQKGFDSRSVQGMKTPGTTRSSSPGTETPSKGCSSKHCAFASYFLPQLHLLQQQTHQGRNSHSTWFIRWILTWFFVATSLSWFDINRLVMFWENWGRVKERVRTTSTVEGIRI